MRRARSTLRDRLLPGPSARYEGPPAAAVLLGVLNAVGTARALVHVGAPDSGAGTIASLDTAGDGGANAVALLAQWGGAQLLESGLIWIVLARYRPLVPLMWATITAEQALRVAIGRRKPLITRRTPPGAASRYLLPATAAGLAWSLGRAQRGGRTSNPRPLAHRGR